MGLGKILAIKNCSNCNKETVIRNKERLNRKNIFCCKKCEGEFKSKNCNNYKPCVVCGKKVYRKPSYIINNNIHNIFCSYQCMGEYRKTHMFKEDNPNYNNIKRKNGDIMYKNGYIYERRMEHPFSDDDGWVRQYRLVAEEYLLNENNSILINNKKYLKQEYDVHHIDFNKHNNSYENLMTLTRSEHQKLHQNIKRFGSTN